MSAHYTIDRSVTPPVIRCDDCGSEERYWDDRQHARYTRAQADACPKKRPRL